MSTGIQHYRAWYHTGVAALAMLGEISLVIAVTRYWHAYRLTTGGTGFYLLYVMLPITTLLIGIASIAASRFYQRRAVEPIKALLRVGILVFLICTLWFTFEYFRSSDSRREYIENPY